jgi:two-component system sensor histidine kinase PilS (NtrC family)
MTGIDPGALIAITLFSLILVFVSVYIVRVAFSFQKKKRAEKDKNTSEVGFVVDTFHDLVTKLKEKERELEALRKLAEEKASSIEIYNEDILQSVPSGVVSFDNDLRITKMNSSAEKILELTEYDSVGQRYDRIFGGPIADIVGRKTAVERAEARYATRTGKSLWLGLNLSLLKDSSGMGIGHILVFTDLTELKAFQSQMELRDRLSTLGEMSGGIAHELRNPMAVISGYTKILSKKVDASLLPAVDAISREVDVMDRIITDFLSFARPTELVISDVDLDELIRNCIRSIEGSAGGIEISCDTEGLPLIKGDEVLLRQSIFNLLRNAIESMPEGGELKVFSSPGNGLTLSVSDTGHGIPGNIRDKIFLPFFTTKEHGTGLGLPIVHKVVGSHGGTILVDSSEKGTTFKITFPGSILVSR